MPELMPPEPRKSSLRKFFIPTVIAVIAIAGFGYIASKAGLDKALVKQQVDAWIERTEKQAAEEGQPVDIHYGDIAIKGGLTDGHAIISDVKIVSDHLSEDTKVTVTTSEIRLEPRRADLREMDVTIPNPIHVFEGKNTAESMSFFSEPALHFSTEILNKSEGEYTRITQALPTKMTLKFLSGQDAQGEEEQEPKLTPRYDTIEVSMAEGSTATMVTSHSHPEIGDSALTIQDLKIVPVGNEIGTIMADAVTTKWENALNDKNVNVVDVHMSLQNLRADESFMPYAPVNAVLNARFEGAMPDSPEALAAMHSTQTSLKLKELSLTTKDASLNATADFVANEDDILPVGTATIALTNIPSWHALLRENDVLKPAQEEVLNTLFLRIVGQSLTEAHDVTLDIKRVRNGSFQIGNTTFEEVLAILFGGVKTPLQAPVKAAPVDAVKAK